jgi:hypothetical protein
MFLPLLYMGDDTLEVAHRLITQRESVTQNDNLKKWTIIAFEGMWKTVLMKIFEQITVEQIFWF